uniref:Translocon-associated protein subunit beta n=1 Tax=Glycine max TaxID=3847 RepID=I1N7Y5_SOYBN
MREFPIVFYIVFSTSGYLLFLLCCILVHLFLQTSAIFSGGIISHTFELEAKSKGVFAGEPAVIKFRVPTKAALQEAYSTPILPLDVLSDRPPEKKFEWAKRLLAKYGSLISVISIMVLFIYLVASPSKSSAKGSKKKR